MGSCWKLINAEQRARENPDSFAIPSARTRQHLRTADLVKLIFQPLSGEKAERMWVRVAGPASHEGHFIGTVYNRPLNSSLPRFGEVVEFGPEHVMDWMGEN